MYFDTYGPIACSMLCSEDVRWRENFWKFVESDDCYGKWPEVCKLKDAVGCYAFGLQNGGKVKIWYVGKTIAKSGFKGEVFQDHKLSHYKSVLESKKGKAVIFIFPLITDKGIISSSRIGGKDAINWLEKTLISMAISANKELKNSKETRFSRGAFVYGLIGGQSPGRPYPEKKAVRAAFGLGD